METREPEVWKAVPGYEGLYEVSSWGNVRSLGRWKKARGNSLHFHPPKNIKINYCGPYPQVCLSRDNNRKSYRVHLFVGELFLEDVDFDFIVNHVDLDKTNNYYKNLEKINRRGNTSHYFLNNFQKTSKFTGVSYDKSKPKCPWVAGFHFKGKSVKVGTFLTEEEAHQAYLDALEEYGLTNKYATKNQE